jgi:hypothetical protein
VLIEVDRFLCHDSSALCSMFYVQTRIMFRIRQTL